MVRRQKKARPQFKKYTPFKELLERGYKLIERKEAWLEFWESDDYHYSLAQRYIVERQYFPHWRIYREIYSSKHPGSFTNEVEHEKSILEQWERDRREHIDSRENEELRDSLLARSILQNSERQHLEDAINGIQDKIRNINPDWHTITMLALKISRIGCGRIQRPPLDGDWRAEPGERQAAD